MKNLIIAYIIVISNLSCTYYEHNFPYNLEEVTRLIELDSKMEEISGLFYKDESTLYAVKDEEGEIFEVNLSSGEHSKIIDFKDKGDFEGIAKAGNHFYVLKSDGDIYKVSKDGESKKSSFFDDDEDFEFEGLAYLPKGNQLLVACKQHGKKEGRKKIYIYSFSIEKGKYSKEPFMVIPRKEIHENFKASALSVAPNGNLFIVSAISFTMAEVSLKGKLI